MYRHFLLTPHREGDGEREGQRGRGGGAPPFSSERDASRRAAMPSSRGGQMGMDHPMSGDIVWNTISSIRFTFYTPEQIRRMSVAQITSPIIFDDLGRPTSGGPYDPRLGPMDDFTGCVFFSVA